jgi:hypothetical protein
MNNPKTSTRSNTEKDPDDWISGDEPMKAPKPRI